MRIADKMTFEQTRENLSKNRTKLAELQNQAATQKRVTKPSDDPVAAARVLSQRVELQGQNQYLKNLDYAKSFLELTDQSLGELSDLLVRAKELALGQSSDASANEQSRRVVGTEVEQLTSQAVMVGNRKLGDRYIFGGYKTSERPFDAQGTYKGDAGEMLVNVDKSSFVSMNVPGNKVFMGIGLSKDGISHVTTEQPLTVEELKSQQMAKKQLDQNPYQRNTYQGEEPQVQMRGPASVGSRAQPQPPPEAIVEAGGKNIFGVLKDLEISLMANDKNGIQDTIEQIDDAINQVILSRSQVGSRVMTLNNTVEHLNKSKVDAKNMISNLEDADIYEVVNGISKTENALQATLSTSGKLIQPTLLDFLR